MAETFVTHLDWSGAAHGPTSSPTTFSRDLALTVAGLQVPCSAAAAFRGDATRANPEQLFVGALSACQALTYLFLAAKHGVSVVSYTDDAEGRLGLADGQMRMTHVVLRPRIVVTADSDREKATVLVEQAHHGCFIANSVSTAVAIEAHVEGQPAP